MDIIKRASIFLLGVLAILSVLATSLIAQEIAQTTQANIPTAPTSTLKKNLKIRGYNFDPLLESKSFGNDLQVKGLLAKEVPPSTPQWRIIQFNSPPDRAAQKRLKAQGLSLQYFVNGGGYIEKVSMETVQTLQARENLRASVPYHPAFKISQTIGKVQYRTEARKAIPGLLLRAIPHLNSDPSAIATAIEAAGGTNVKVMDDRDVGGAGQIIFELANESTLPAIVAIEDIRRIEEVGEIIDDNVNAATTNQSGTAGVSQVWNQNLNGQDQIIGIMDNGPADINHCFFQDPVNNTTGPAHRKVVALRNASGTAAGGHATFTAGNAAGDDFNNPGTAARRGGAWAARLVIGNRHDLGSATLLSEFSAARDSGAVIHTNSWHDNTQGAGNAATYNQNAEDTDRFLWLNEDHLVFGSMGNNGEEQGPPGTAKNAVGVNAAQADPNEGNIGDGNPGPTADGRRKPDIVAVGCNIQSATVSTACTVGPRSACATSYATPHTAAMATLARQYYMEGYYPSGTAQPHHAFTPSGGLLKATIINSARNMAGVAGYPAANEGWGIITLDQGLFFPGDPLNMRVWDFRNATGIATGETKDFPLPVAQNGQPLKVTLVWTEPPGESDNQAVIVNDLDLQVIAPDGITFRGAGANYAGGFTTAGGVADTLNNVEQVVINNPAVGNWTIRVIGTAVNVGNPWQGFAVVASADLNDPPATTGDQNTLVVRVRFPDADLVGIDPLLPSIQNTMADVVSYFDAVTYGEATILPAYYPNIIDLDLNSGNYFPPLANPVIELTEEVLTKMIAANPAVLDPDPVNTNDDIERLIIVTNDQDFVGDYATTGDWPFDVPGVNRPLSISIQSFSNPVERFTHGLLHQFGLIDLYAHEGVIFDFPHTNGWDNMAVPFMNQHSLVWNKQRPGWLTSHGSEVRWIPRPAAGGSYGGLNPIPIFTQDSTDVNRKGIMIGLSPGVTNAADESLFYFVEARDNTDTYDSSLPESGVLIYYVNENVSQGEGPVWLLDADPGTETLADAAFQINESRAIPGTGIEITVQAPAGAGDYDIQITYTPLATNNDVNIVKGDTIDGTFKNWMSPDIWVDNQRNGFDEDGGGAPNPNNSDQVIEGELNRLYFRLHNPGPASAFDVDTFVRISEPYHTIGGAADFNRFLGQRRFDQIAVNANPIGFVEWIPESDGDPHSCAWVETLDVFNDVNGFNNQAQENLREITSSTSSPYTPVVHTANFTNPYDVTHLFYFRADGVPDTWTSSLSPRKALLAPGEKVTVALDAQPPEDAPYCTDHVLDLRSWVSRGDTLVTVGGTTTQVGLRKGTKIEAETEVIDCRKVNAKDQVVLTHAGALRETNAEGNQSSAYQALATGQRNVLEEIARVVPQNAKQCAVIVEKGCTDPIRAFEEVIIRYEDPAGNPVYHTVTTDANGCFEDFYVATEGGEWTMTAEYPGDDCSGPARSEPTTVQPNLPSDGDQDNDGLPDAEEHPSDADGDGLVGPADRDSDNDGVLDGEEPKGDIDGDGFINVIDPDADGDGIMDGRDSTPWGDTPQVEECKKMCDEDRQLFIWLIIVGVICLILLLWILLRFSKR